MSTGTPAIVVIGDSITQQGAIASANGFVSLLCQDYVRKADIINRGCSGWTTRTWLPKLELLLTEWAHRAPALVLIFLGANDAALPHARDAHQHVPLDEYAANLAAMVDTLRAASPDSRFLLITPAAIEDAKYASRSNVEAGKYADACIAVGYKKGVPVLDVWRPMQGRPELLRDGLHLSVEGNTSIHRWLTTTIAEQFPALTPDALPTVFQ
ncbi:hypothetical protein SPRG_21307 [Saprolegnia parasitica CBS 223.65]|uniref:SGNH hydrolase-type esterase domain-containing protein n=1 Tax=Saprolegnia parasitica (strain CBS 223.65) TaxID=695850 RepID=A0A067BQ12_SAPPC|nr:hypothetical protein SPRG_21307 [Saprolegnia parasitica CBS 223.65]KDO20584.1 hypothetical protein SPRG_21307 [Saprolegnia parasitica CBS 223.65]|eukprot:XP_012208713.1 hypothetical protein SPRG_21307 [Saprolegnia parasitica CBS 223.65]